MANGDGAFFLDTSTQISKTWEDEKIRCYLNKELSQKPCYCSLYVKNEYKHNILKDAILVYNYTVDSGTLVEAQSRLDAIMRKIGKRPDSLPYKVFRRLFKEYNSKKPFLRKLEKIIELAWSNYFDGNIRKPLFNLVECNSAQDDPYKKGNHYFGMYSRCSSGCKIDDFLKDQESSLKAIASIDDEKINQTDDSKDTFKKIKSASMNVLDGASPHGKLCKEMSDAVIIIEAEASFPGIIIHSMDADFKLLGEVLNVSICLQSKHNILNS